MDYGEFYTFVEANSAKEAFEKAKEQAIKMYGISSHSCSPADKQDFKEYLPNVSNTRDLCNSLLDDLINKSKEDSTREELDAIKERIHRIKRERTYFRVRAKRSGKEKAIAIAHLLIEMEDEHINSPEKAAGVIQILKNEWLVFGIANE